jgi:hypothetical protein
MNSILNTKLEDVDLDDTPYSSGSEDTAKDGGVHLDIEIEDDRY